MTQRIRLLIASLVLLSCGKNLFSQDFFQKTYNHSFSDNCHASEILTNGDIVVVGACQSDSKIWVQRLNGKGEVLWSKTFDNNELIGASDICKTPDGNLLVTFNTIATQSKGGWMKIAQNGELLSSRTIPGFVRINKVLRLSNGGYLLSGYGSGSNVNFIDPVVVKINEAGNVVWSARFGDVDNDLLHNCWEDSQGFIYCVGEHLLSGKWDGLLAKFSPTGALLWVRFYDTSGFDALADIKPFSADSTLLLAGTTDAGSGAFGRVWLTKVTRDGDIKWSRTYSLPDVNLGAVDVFPLLGNQFLVSVADPAYQVGSPAILMKIAEGGDILWNYQYKTGGERGIFQNVLPVTGGFVAAGTSTKNGDADFYVAKIAADGLIPSSDCCPAFAPLTVKDILPQNKPFTSSAQGGFTAQNAQIVSADILPETTNICTPIDLEFTLSDSTLCPKECVEITLVGNTPGVMYSLEIQGGGADAAQPGKICHTGGGTLFVTRKGVNSICEIALTKSIPVGNRADAFANAFTPNGDGVNDTYKPLFLCPVVTTSFKIYTRWGEKVFETQDPNEAWDGKINGLDAPSDVYVWQVEYEAERDGVRQKLMEKGDVALLR